MCWLLIYMHAYNRGFTAQEANVNFIAVHAVSLVYDADNPSRQTTHSNKLFFQ